MEVGRTLSRKVVEARLQTCRMFKCELKHNNSRQVHHSTRSSIIKYFESHKKQVLFQKSIGLVETSLQQWKFFSNDDKDKNREVEKDDYVSSDDEDKGVPIYDKLIGGQRVKELLEEAQTQTLKDDFETADDKRTVARKRTFIDPKDMSVFLFPGQGTQLVGMGKALLSYPNVKEMFEVASEILGYDLLSLCLNGPQVKLNQTIHCQPAVVITSLAAVEKLKHENPKLVENCVAAAGFSVGEITALVFSGALSFEEAVYLIKVRAEAMQYASNLVESGMLSVVGRDSTNYKIACQEAKEHCRSEEGIQDPVCSIANYMFPNARVIAGHAKALDFLQTNSKKFSLRSAKRIPVSGAFHTDLMKPAQEELAAALSEINFEIPVISVHSNVDGKQYQHAKHIRKQLKRQVIMPVKWEQSMHEIYQRKPKDNFPVTVEVGPGNQLGTILKRNNVKAAQTYQTFDV
ncbi:malonyl-CoA-acyl carrier protein transacylase, mitochondrial-like isoform X2 [Antedon mediterranea]